MLSVAAMHISLYLFVFCQVQCLFLEVRGNEEEVEYFFTTALQCVVSLQGSNDFVQERRYRELEDHTRTLSVLLAAVARNDPDNRGVGDLLGSLYRCFCNLLRDYEARQSSGIVRNLLPPTTLTGRPGRPRFSISAEQISHCLGIGMTWQRIATSFGINRRTLYRHRQILGVEPLSFATLSNQELDNLVNTILHNTPNAGEAYVLGSLRSRGLRVQRWRVRQSLHRVDPIGRSFRRRHAIRRRVYDVQSPNQLW